MFGKPVNKSDLKSTQTVLAGAGLLAGASVVALLTGASVLGLGLAFTVATSQPAFAVVCNNSGAGGANTGDDAANQENTACGRDSRALNGVGATGGKSSAFGWRADALAQGSVAVGRNSQVDARSQDGIAIGTNSHVEDIDASTGSESAIAIGRNSFAQGDAPIALGRDARSTGRRSIAIGRFAMATNERSIAMGSGADATGIHSIAIGGEADADSLDSMALGFNADASHSTSTAIGAFATTTMSNQIVLGTSTETYTMRGITSNLSRDRQSGPLELLTTDADGNLASDGGEIIDGLNEGIAIALALENPDLKGDETFGIAVNGGYFKGEYAVGAAIMATLVEGNGVRLAVAGGAGYGVETEEVGARGGFQLTW